MLNINFDFQGFVNNQYIVKGSIAYNKNRYSVLVEGPTLDEAKTKASNELKALIETAPVQKKQPSNRGQKRKILSKGIEV